MCIVEFRTNIDPATFQTVYSLYVGEKELPFVITLELLQDLRAMHFGTTVANEIRDIFKYELEEGFWDIHLQLTQQELDKIWELVEEKLK